MFSFCAHRYFVEPFVYPVSVLLDLGMLVSCSYHVITSSLLCMSSGYELSSQPWLCMLYYQVFEHACMVLELKQHVCITKQKNGGGRPDKKIRMHDVR